MAHNRNHKRSTAQSPPLARAGGGAGAYASPKSDAAGPAPTVDIMLTHEEIDSMVPAGNPDDWTDTEWDSLEFILERLDDDMVDQVWDEVQSRWSYPESKPSEYESAYKGTDHMTDDEFYEYLFGAGAADPKDAKPKTVEPKSKDPLKDCTCAGPGSVEDKYKSHIFACPCYTGPATTGSGYTYKSCKHIHDVVDLEGGVKVQASASSDVKEYDKDLVDYGVYASSGWVPDIVVSPGFTAPWFGTAALPINTIHLDWPDYGVPALPIGILTDVLTWMLETAKGGKKVETGCMGGHGRTGTMLALLLCQQGVKPATAITRVRTTYCKEAIESLKQIEYIGDYYDEVHGPEWRADKTEADLFDTILEDNKPKYASSWDYGTKYKTKGKHSLPALPAGNAKAVKGGGY